MGPVIPQGRDRSPFTFRRVAAASVLLLMAALYVSPVQKYLRSDERLQRSQTQVVMLQHEHDRLQSEAAALLDEGADRRAGTRLRLDLPRRAPARDPGHPGLRGHPVRLIGASQLCNDVHRLCAESAPAPESVFDLRESVGLSVPHGSWSRRP